VIDWATKKRLEMAESINEVVRQLGGWVVSRLDEKILRIECPKFSKIPELGASGWHLVPIGANERIMTVKVETIRDGKGELVRQLSHDGIAEVDVFQLDLLPSRKP
jgi:hypothetical protein